MNEPHLTHESEMIVQDLGLNTFSFIAELSRQ